MPRTFADNLLKTNYYWNTLRVQLPHQQRRIFKTKPQYWECHLLLNTPREVIHKTHYLRKIYSQRDKSQIYSNKCQPWITRANKVVQASPRLWTPNHFGISCQFKIHLVTICRTFKPKMLLWITIVDMEVFQTKKEIQQLLRNRRSLKNLLQDCRQKLLQQCGTTV